MSAAAVAITAVIADAAVILLIGLAAVGACWNLVRSGKIRLSAPSVAQIEAEQGQGADEPGEPGGQQEAAA